MQGVYRSTEKHIYVYYSRQQAFNNNYLHYKLNLY
jgi:hypothetical protein